MVELFDPNNLFEMGSKKRRPVMCGDYLSLLCRHKLGMIAHSRLVDDVCYVSHTTYRCVLKKTLEQPKAPIGAEIRMSHYQERVSYVCMSSSHYPPHQVLHHAVVFKSKLCLYVVQSLPSTSSTPSCCCFYFVWYSFQRVSVHSSRLGHAPQRRSADG